MIVNVAGTKVTRCQKCCAVNEYQENINRRVEDFDLVVGELSSTHRAIKQAIEQIKPIVKQHEQAREQTRSKKYLKKFEKKRPKRLSKRVLCCSKILDL